MKNIVLIVSVLIFIMGCKSEDNQPDCGCKGVIAFTISISDQQIGYLYSSTSGQNDNLPEYNYGIWFDEIECGNCIHKFLVCNDNFLSDFGDIPPYPGIKVEFSGDVKYLCKNISSPADYTYNYLIITKIEKQ